MPEPRPTRLPRDNHRPGSLTFLRPLIAFRPTLGRFVVSRRRDSPLANVAWNGRARGGTGISTSCASTTPFGLALAPDSPWEEKPSPGTLGLSAEGFLTPLYATHASILTRIRSTDGHPPASVQIRRSPTPPYVCMKDTASVVDLAPLHYLRKITRPVSCYALFQGWLLLSQPPGCLGNLTSFST